jgi:hypothetical protein
MKPASLTSRRRTDPRGTPMMRLKRGQVAVEIGECGKERLGEPAAPSGR